MKDTGSLLFTAGSFFLYGKCPMALDGNLPGNGSAEGRTATSFGEFGNGLVDTA